MDQKKKAGKSKNVGIMIAGILAVCVIVVSGAILNQKYSILDQMLSLISMDAAEITVDFNNTIADMKDLSGMNNGPKSGYDSETGGWELDMTEVYQELNISMVRTHDSEYPYGQDLFVDIHCIFPDMTQDVDDPDSYYFEETDEYIAAIIESGAQVFFRLGESIDHSGEDTYINPPEDYTKWAQICEHIIRHYNEGWADGYTYNIEYWEIWNEPDNSSMWTGSMEEYYELYRVTARYIKEIYPDLKVGGAALATSSAENIASFLESLTADGQDTPLDFLSWHLYTNDPGRYADRAYEIRAVLDEYGYEDTESILDEWNYIESWSDVEGAAEQIHSMDGAAFIAASLIAMQYSPVDRAMYYDGQYSLADIWCGIYNSEGEIQPGYYAFLYFNQLYQLGEQVSVTGEQENLYYCAATGDGNGILLVNYALSGEQSIYVKIRYSGAGQKVTIHRINEENPDSITTEELWLFREGVLEIAAGEVVYIEVDEERNSFLHGSRLGRRLMNQPEKKKIDLRECAARR